MSYARWNPVEYYVIGDIVYDSTAAYQCILGNGPLTPQQPSLSPLYWTVLTVGGITAVTSQTGSGIAVSTLAGVADVATNLVAGGGVTLTPSGVNTSITISATPFATVYGGFYSTVSQVLANAAGVGAGNPVYFTYDSVAIAVGCARIVGTGGGLSALQVNANGVYRVVFSIQWDKFGGGGTNNFQCWVAVDGTPVPWTNSEIDTSQQINQLATVEITLSLNAGQYVEVVGYVPVGSNHCQALANSIDATHPVAIPSIITSITRIA